MIFLLGSTPMDRIHVRQSCPVARGLPVTEITPRLELKRGRKNGSSRSRDGIGVASCREQRHSVAITVTPISRPANGCHRNLGPPKTDLPWITEMLIRESRPSLGSLPSDDVEGGVFVIEGPGNGRDL